MANNNLKKDFWMKYHLNFPISGGNGENKENSIKISLENNLGILLEKDIIACLYCEGEYDFKLIEQIVQEVENNYYDYLKIELSNGAVKEIYFDITNFFGKSSELFKRDEKEYNEMILKMTIRPNAEEEMSWFK